MVNRKWAMLVIGIIIGLVVGAGLGYSSTLAETARLRDEHDQLKLQFEGLNATYNTLNATYNWLRQHSFTYYIVGNEINISNVGIFKESEWFDWWTINGTITNISDKPIETVYVYLILRNPDGTADFSTSNYDEIENLYIGETATFEFSYVYYNESQTIEIFLIY
jgi:hypothetical protein